MNNDLKINCSKHLINKGYRNIISKYLLIEYESNVLGSRNENKYFSIDECNILNIDNIHIWLLGIINTGTKNFLWAPTISGDSDSLKYFISKYVEKGNYIIIDGGLIMVIWIDLIVII